MIPSSSKTSPIVGIDHGTTNSCVAVHRNGLLAVACNSEGHRITRSMVGYSRHSDPVVGITAKELDKGAVLFDMKRLLGKTSNDRAVKLLSRYITFIYDDEDEDEPMSNECGDSGSDVPRRPLIPVCSRDQQLLLRPVDVCAKVLEKMRASANRLLNNNSQQPVDVTRAVIAVPAHFNQLQKAETKEAARLAGLTVEELITEPVAAAYAYGYDSSRFTDYKILVFDLGGGTLDVTVIQVTDGEFEVLALNGDLELGGSDFDHALEEWCWNQIQQCYDFTLTEQNRRKLLDKCEDAKKCLTQMDRTVIYLNVFSPLLADKELEITREKFVELTSHLVERAMDITEQVLIEAKLAPDQIDEILLSGGSSRIPLVQAKLAELFPGKQFNNSVSEDEVVAQGAAVRAAQLCNTVRSSLPKMSIVDRTALGLGVDAHEGIFDVMLPRLSPIPSRRTKEFLTTANDQTEMEFTIYEGQRKMAADNFRIGSVLIRGIKKAAVRKSSVALTITLDQSGQLEVVAKHGKVLVRETFDYSSFTSSASSETVKEKIQEANKNTLRDAKAFSKARALSALKLTIEDEEYGIPTTESHRNSKQSAKATLCQSQRKWIERNVDAPEKKLRSQLAKFKSECRKCK